VRLLVPAVLRENALSATLCIAAVFLLAWAAGHAVAAAPQTGQDWRAVCERLRVYTYGKDNDADLRAVERCLQHARPEELPQIEAALVSLLGDSKVSAEARQFVCRQGALFRSPQAVAALIALQADERFSQWACLGLGRMSGPAAAAALRDALGKRSGRQRVDVIQTLGGLGDRQAVPLLAPELKAASKDTGLAAIVALGKIGGPEAEKALAQFEPHAPAEHRRALAEARLACAADLPASRAVQIFESYLKAPQTPVRMAALAGLLQRQPERRSARLVEAIGGGDAALRSVALREARHGGGEDLTRGLVAAVAGLPAREQAVLVGVLAERGDRVALPELLKLVSSEDAAVRTAALAAIGRLGDASHVALLVRGAAAAKDEPQRVLRIALARWPAAGVDEQLVRLAADGEPAVRAEALQPLAARGAAATGAVALRVLDDQEPQVQKEAISALRALAGSREYPELIRRTLAAESGTARQRLQEVLVTVCRRSTSAEACVDLLLQARQSASPEAQDMLLGILGEIGGAKSLATLRQTLQSSESESRKSALRALAGWPDAAPLSEVIQIIRATPDAAEKVLAIRAALAMVARDAKMGDPAKAARLRELVDLSPRPDEKRRALGQLASVRCRESLQLAVALLDDAQVANEAAAAVVGIGRAFARFGVPAQEMRAAMEKAAKAAKVPAVQKAAKDLLKTLPED